MTKRRTDIDERKSEIIAWLESGVSQREVAARVECKIDTLRTRLKFWGVSHLKNQPGKGIAKYGARRSVQDYLKADSPTSSYRLKYRLWDEGLKPIECEDPACSWEGDWDTPDGRIILELDHADGDHNNNLLDNLRILCPNCHARKEGNNPRTGMGARDAMEQRVYEQCRDAGTGRQQALRTLGP